MVGKGNPENPHSDFPGVFWDKQKSKWQGRVCDRSVRVDKGPKQIYVGYFDDERACAAAVAAKQAEIDAAIAEKLHAMAQELPHTRGLPLRPKHAADADPDTAYYGEKRQGAKGEPSIALGCDAVITPLFFHIARIVLQCQERTIARYVLRPKISSSFRVVILCAHLARQRWPDEVCYHAPHVAHLARVSVERKSNS